MSSALKSFRGGLRIAGFLAVAVRSDAANEYIYGIGSDWALYQLTVDPVANTVSVAKQSVNLTGFISGWWTRYNEVLNRLGIDQSTGDICFNYSYNCSATSTSGTMSVVPYIYQNQNGAYKIPYALGAAVSSPTLAATDALGGWVPRATCCNGSYYAGMQATDTFVVLPITGSTTKS